MKKIIITVILTITNAAFSNGQSGNRPPSNNRSENRGGTTNDVFRSKPEPKEHSKVEKNSETRAESLGGGIGFEMKPTTK
jgi:hypothetical protein